MQNETLLKNIKNDLDTAISLLDNQQAIALLQRTQKQIDAQLENPDVLPHCGLYLHDGYRTYGYTRKQLEYLMDQWFDPKSVFYQQTWGFPQLVKWLCHVSRTSIGDLRADLFKHVVVSYEYPDDDMTDEQYDELDASYNDFWEKAAKIVEHLEQKHPTPPPSPKPQPKGFIQRVLRKFL